MGLLGALEGVVSRSIRGADRVSKFTGKRGPRDYYAGRGARPTGRHTCSGKYAIVPEMVPEFVVPTLTGCTLRPYVSYKTPDVKAEATTARSLFESVIVPEIETAIRNGTFEPTHLENYGFEPTQEGKLFKLYPKNYTQ
uniref:large ribosomal subunit protein mL41A-like n=1 Tax=Myxine glutinosa TaxID=7769 RepID=UPI00358E239E